MKLSHPLRYHALLGAIDLVIVSMAMISFSTGIGVMIGITVARAIFAVREHRRERRRAEKSVALDARLSAALERVTKPVVIDVVAVNEKRSS